MKKYRILFWVPDKIVLETNSFSDAVKLTKIAEYIEELQGKITGTQQSTFEPIELITSDLIKGTELLISAEPKNDKARHLLQVLEDIVESDEVLALLPSWNEENIPQKPKTV